MLIVDIDIDVDASFDLDCLTKRKMCKAIQMSI